VINLSKVCPIYTNCTEPGTDSENSFNSNRATCQSSLRNLARLVGSAQLSTDQVRGASPALFSWREFQLAARHQQRGRDCRNRRCPRRRPHLRLYTRGQLTDLNLLVDPSLPLITTASGINDKGQIVVSGLNGQLYVLTPKG
jgi:hypothetical protein